MSKKVRKYGSLPTRCPFYQWKMGRWSRWWTLQHRGMGFAGREAWTGAPSAWLKDFFFGSRFTHGPLIRPTVVKKNIFLKFPLTKRCPLVCCIQKGKKWIVCMIDGCVGIFLGHLREDLLLWETPYDTSWLNADARSNTARDGATKKMKDQPTTNNKKVPFQKQNK